MRPPKQPAEKTRESLLKKLFIGSNPRELGHRPMRRRLTEI
jgi:hypothetical protein